MTTVTQFAYRTLKGIGIVNGPPTYEALKDFTRPEGNLRCCLYSTCGRYFAWATTERVNIIDAATGDVISTLPAENVYELGFSPKGTYVITWQRPSKDEAGDAVKNLKVWRVLERQAIGEVDKQTVGKFVQKNQTGWNLQYTFDEKFCARVVTNEVQIYESHDLTQVWNKLRVEGVSDFAVSPGENHSIAVFVPERKGSPASVRVYNVPDFESPASRKNFFKGDKVQLKWNDNGTTLIVLAQTEVDKSGKSYYGETTMYLLSAKGGFDSRIDLDKEGPIHDVSWSPKSNSFAVVYGYMPAKTVIFNAKAEATHTFPLAPRNTVSFSPYGRFLLVAGFGNLAGQMDIYDLEKDYTKICTVEASNASVCEWSPDGKQILTATTSPRLRVDNGIRIWHVSGGLMYNEDLNELYHVCWRPTHGTAAPLEDNPCSHVPVPHASALKYLGSVKTPSKPAGAYRPPGARGQVTPLAFKREDEGGAAYVRDGVSSFASNINGFGKSRARMVPGAEGTESKGPLPPGAAPGGGVSLTGTGEEKNGEPLSKAAKKNAKKREAKKAAAAAATTEGAGADDGVSGQPSHNTVAADSTSKKSGRRLEEGPGQEYPVESGQRPSHAPAPAIPPGFESAAATGGQGTKSPSQQRHRVGSTPSKPAQRSANQSNGTPTKGPVVIQRRGESLQQAAPAATATEAPAAQKTPNLPTNIAIATNLSPSLSSPPPPPPASDDSNSTSAAAQDKKIRGLLKKVRAIEDLKMRLAGGEKLEDTQMKKIFSEEGVRRELGSLGYVG